jgi:hypothetical protein
MVLLACFVNLAGLFLSGSIVRDPRASLAPALIVFFDLKELLYHTRTARRVHGALKNGPTIPCSTISSPPPHRVATTREEKARALWRVCLATHNTNTVSRENEKRLLLQGRKKKEYSPVHIPTPAGKHTPCIYIILKQT